MKVAYVDTSVLASLLFSEKESAQWRRYLNACDEIVSSSLAEAELLSAASREKISLLHAEKLLDAISLISPDRSLRSECIRVLSAGHCRGADTYHLACALYLDPDGKELEFLTADKRQAEVAKTLGLRVKLN